MPEFRSRHHKFVYGDTALVAGTCAVGAAAAVLELDDAVAEVVTLAPRMVGQEARTLLRHFVQTRRTRRWATTAARTSPIAYGLSPRFVRREIAPTASFVCKVVIAIGNRLEYGLLRIFPGSTRSVRLSPHSAFHRWERTNRLRAGRNNGLLTLKKALA